MRLIGMLDSPFVRRVAVSMRLMGLPFTHESVSVFRQFDDFARVNPVVKAPTLVTDAGVMLMDSTLILEHVERLAAPERRLTPEAQADHARSQHLIGLALAACEKTVQIVYEFNVRPEDKRHGPWLERVTGQLLAAYGLLEAELGDRDAWLFGDRPMQADITIAVAWRFTQFVAADRVLAADHPKLAAFSARAEALEAFVAAPLE
ncbi:MAG: glutathione S-transferase [Caulobacteraceae bacterium]|nr:glutathione S-transferase [Caulobacteraceae bacterium]